MLCLFCSFIEFFSCDLLHTDLHITESMCWIQRIAFCYISISPSWHCCRLVVGFCPVHWRPRSSLRAFDPLGSKSTTVSSCFGSTKNVPRHLFPEGSRGESPLFGNHWTKLKDRSSSFTSVSLTLREGLSLITMGGFAGVRAGVLGLAPGCPPEVTITFSGISWAVCWKLRYINSQWRKS